MTLKNVQANNLQKICKTLIFINESPFTSTYCKHSESKILHFNTNARRTDFNEFLLNY